MTGRFAKFKTMRTCERETTQRKNSLHTTNWSRIGALLFKKLDNSILPDNVWKIAISLCVSFLPTTQNNRHQIALVRLAALHLSGQNMLIEPFNTST